MSQHLILVVEDEPLLRLQAVTFLEDAGCATLAVASADEAVGILESDADIIAVFTDVDMPGSMDGLRLAATIRDRWPPIEVIVTSGHVQVEDDDLPERGLFLPKPYTAAQLTRALHTLHLCDHRS